MNDCLKIPAFFVGEINDDENLLSPPISGEDYIKRVVHEAQRCDSVVVAQLDESKFHKPTIRLAPLEGCVEAPQSLKPTAEWQESQITDFSSERLKMAGLKALMEKNGPGKFELVRNLPRVDDENGWTNFCTEYLPTLGTVFAMSHQTVERVLEYLVEVLETKGTMPWVETRLGHWIYALLAVLELPLNPEMCSLLRTLARRCSSIRAKIAVEKPSPEDHRVTALNLFICLVSRYFRQFDLADT